MKRTLLSWGSAKDSAWSMHLLRQQMLREFQPEIDPCGKNGAFHTVVCAGPMFHHSLSVEVGEMVSRDDFSFPALRLSQKRVSAA